VELAFEQWESVDVQSSVLRRTVLRFPVDREKSDNGSMFSALLHSRPVVASPDEGAYPSANADVKHAQIFETYGRSSLTFESNPEAVGPVKFLSRGSGYSLFVTPTEAVVVLRKPRLGASCKPQTRDRGSAPHRVVAPTLKHAWKVSSRYQAKTHSFPGNDPRKWRTKSRSTGR